MPGLGDWLPQRSDGTLPLDATAGQLQVRFFLDCNFAIHGIGISSKNVEASWEYQILDTDNTTVLFHQKVTVTLNITALSFASYGTGGLSLWVWRFVKEKIDTKKVNGETITAENPAWKYTLGGTDQSEFGTMEKGAGSDYTDFEGIIQDWHGSAVYRMRVPVGAKLKIIRVQVQGGSVARNLRFQFRFKDTAERISIITDEVGAIRQARVANDQLLIEHYYPGLTDRYSRSSIPRVEDAIIWKSRNRTLYVLALQAPTGTTKRAWRLWKSLQEAVDLQPLLYIEGDDEGEQVSLWSGEVRYPSIAQTRQGVWVSCGLLGQNIVFQHTSDLAIPGDVRVIGTHKGKPCVVLPSSIADGRNTIRINDGYTVDLVSDTMFTTPVPTPEGT